MQLDGGSEPYLSTAQALCLCIGHIFYYKSFVNWQRITDMGKSERLSVKEMSPFSNWQLLEFDKKITCCLAFFCKSVVHIFYILAYKRSIKW